MYALQQARQEVLLALKTALGKTYSPTLDELEAPKIASHGDIAFPCFGLAKGFKRSPVEITSEIAPKIKPQGMIASVDANGPYINFRLSTPALAERVIDEARQETYGTSSTLTAKTIMVEYAQPNTHKEVHVGHLRNALVGQVVVELLRAHGARVIPTSYINDLGAHVAKCLWGIQKFHPGEKPEKGEENIFLAKVYTEATQWLDANPEEKVDIQKIFQSLENGHRGWRMLWKKTRGWSMTMIRGVFKDLGLTIEQWYFESDLVKSSKAIVEDLMRRGIAKRSDGAVIVPLEEEKLGVNLLERTDGTLLYNAKDLALAFQKEEDYRADLSLYVVDVRQSLAMKQLFATLKRMGFNRTLQHLSYEIVTLPDGVMSSRKGNVIRYEDLRDKVMQSARQETRARHSDWSDKKVDEIAHHIAFAALKFYILKQDLDKIVIFETKQALAFDGFTGPYVLYTMARIQSILRKRGAKKGVDKSGAHETPFGKTKEAELLRKIAEYPDVLQRVVRTYQISAIAQYAFDLAKSFADFYQDVPVLKATGAVREARLALCEATHRTLIKALSVLGIESVREM
ncbi:MAG: arginine--tRNA ligase [Patescibacteria group bacterium]